MTTENAHITEQQEHANAQLLERLQRIPVLLKQVQMLERQGMQQRVELAELAVELERTHANNESLIQELAALREETKETSELTENSES